MTEAGKSVDSLIEKLKCLEGRVFTIFGRNRYCRIFDGEVQEFQEYSGTWIRSDISTNYVLSDDVLICRIDYTTGVPLSLPVSFICAIQDMEANEEAMYIRKKKVSNQCEHGIYRFGCSSDWERLNVKDALSYSWIKIS